MEKNIIRWDDTRGARMAKFRSKYVCSECGYESSGWMGKCPLLKVEYFD